MMEQELLMVTVKDLSLREGGVLGHLPAVIVIILPVTITAIY